MRCSTSCSARKSSTSGRARNACRRAQELAASLRIEGRRPFAIPIGASTPLGALAFALAVAELVDQMPAPDVIVHSTSSGGTQAGLVAGCRLLGLPTRVIGVSADDSSSSLEAQVNAIVTGIGDLLQLDRGGARKRDGDRSGRSVCRRRVRCAVRPVARSDRAQRAHGSDLPGSNLHGEGDGWPHRLCETAAARGRADRRLLAHRRPGRIVRVTRNETHQGLWSNARAGNISSKYLTADTVPLRIRQLLTTASSSKKQRGPDESTVVEVVGYCRHGDRRCRRGAQRHVEIW